MYNENPNSQNSCVSRTHNLYDTTKHFPKIGEKLSLSREARHFYNSQM